MAKAKDLGRAALVLAGLCAWGAAAAADAPAAPATDRGLVLSSFELASSNGYKLEVTSGRGGNFQPTVALAAERGSLHASYEVRGGVGPKVRADFGSLGAVALDFHRQKRTIERPAKGCVFIAETGLFRGTFSFVGEGGYTAAETTSVPGQVSRIPNGFCSFEDDRANFRVPDFLTATHLKARARTGNGFVEFGATASPIERPLRFGAVVEERQGAIKITRSAFAAGAGADRLNRAKPGRSIVLDPPPPFEGSARFRDPPTVPPPGPARSTPPSGSAGDGAGRPGFAVKLCPTCISCASARSPCHDPLLPFQAAPRLAGAGRDRPPRRRLPRAGGHRQGQG